MGGAWVNFGWKSPLGCGSKEEGVSGGGGALGGASVGDCGRANLEKSCLAE